VDSTDGCNTLGAYAGARSVADEAKAEDLLHGKAESVDVGALAAGESLHQIAQLFDRNHSSIQRILAETGGIRPAQRRRSRLALTLAEREEISRALASGHSIRSIASLLKRAPSTISREIQRNGGQSCYRASQADQAAWDRARRPKTCRLAENRTLARIVATKLRLMWSPEQIAGWLKRTYPDGENGKVSHETIYRSLFIQARGVLKKELLQHLRRTRAMRRSRQHTQKSDDRRRIHDAVSISERPATSEDRAHRDTGKAIYCAGVTAVRLQLSSNVNHAT